jgi:tyrosine-protein phosphatase YwqE
MLSFFSKKSGNLTNIGLDMHNHILPGLDDGAVGIEESLKLRHALKQKGIDTCIFTPHIFKELYPNTASSIAKKFNLITAQTAYKIQYPNDRFAAEYMVDHDFFELLENGTPLLCIKDKKVLIEFPIIMLPLNYEDVIFNLRLAGYTPILAHPERYLYLAGKQNKETCIKLKDMGCEFQLNLLSLNGIYGKLVKTFATELLKDKMYDYASTDIHHPYQLSDLDVFLKSGTWGKWSKYVFRNNELA